MTTTTAPPVDLPAVVDRDLLQAMRLGQAPAPYDDLVGFVGIAGMLDFRTRAGQPAEQTVRALACNPHRRFPAPVATVRLDGSDVRLFSRAEVARWAIQTHRLAPDGVTPLRLKPRRGRARRPRRQQ